MKTAITTLGLTLFLALCTAVFADEEQQKRTERDEPLTTATLAGTYTIVSSQKGDEKTPADQLEGAMVTFTENTIVATDADKKQMYAATFKLDNSQTPAVITMVSTLQEHKGAKATGLIQGDGRTLKLIYALPDEAELPAKFEPAKGQRMMVLKKIEKTASVPVEVKK